LVVPPRRGGGEQESRRTNAMMELVEASKTYQQGRRVVHALRGVSLRIEAGEFVSIMGPSGSGKSTLLHLLGALDTPSQGQVLFDGRDLRTLSDRERSLIRRTRIGFIFQFFNLLQTLTAVENVALPLMLAGLGRNRARDRALEALEGVGLTDRADHFPEELSGGEMQRVAIARALVTEPEAVLCDEPTGNLDSATGKEILALLRRLPEAGRRAVVMVTHDPQAAAYAERIIHIRDGLVEADRRTVRREGSEPREHLESVRSSLSPARSPLTSG
jgi:putative ABC transport system ATP-binding protein